MSEWERKQTERQRQPEKEREAVTAICGRPEREKVAHEGPAGGGSLHAAVVSLGFLFSLFCLFRSFPFMFPCSSYVFFFLVMSNFF
jgi:hypothetical protein